MADNYTSATSAFPLPDIDNTLDVDVHRLSSALERIDAAFVDRVPVSSYTGTTILTLLSPVDGAGSGLDADLLDGLNSTAFAAAVHAHDVATSASDGFMSSATIETIAALGTGKLDQIESLDEINEALEDGDQIAVRDASTSATKQSFFSRVWTYIKAKVAGEPVAFAVGSESDASIAKTGFAATGLFFPSGGGVGVTVGASERARFNSEETALRVFGGARFGSNSADVYVSPSINNCLNSQFEVDADNVGMFVNYRGYNDGATRDRHLTVCDGKEGIIAKFFGATKRLVVGGDHDVGGDCKLHVAGDSLTYSPSSASNATQFVRATEANNLVAQTMYQTKNGAGTDVGGAIGYYSDSLRIAATGNITTPAVRIFPAGGNVCINKATDLGGDYRLQVAGRAHVDGGVTTDETLTVTGEGTNAGRDLIKLQNIITGTQNTAAVALYSGATAVGRISTFGTEYTVIPAVAGMTVVDNNTDNAGVALRANNTGGVIKFLLAGHTERMRLANGFLAVGTDNLSNPEAGLHLMGSDYTRSAVRLTRSAWSPAQSWTWSINANKYLTAREGSMTGTNDLFAITPSGATIINTVTDNGSGAKLQVNGMADINGRLRFKPGSSGMPANNGEVEIALVSNTQLRFRAKGTDGVIRYGDLTLST
jgi:hypothetical protein